MIPYLGGFFDPIGLTYFWLHKALSGRTLRRAGIPTARLADSRTRLSQKRTPSPRLPATFVVHPINQTMQLTPTSITNTLASTPPTPHLHFYHQGRQSMPLCELVSLQSAENYTWLIWANGKRLLMPRTLKYYEAQLPTDGFIRLHRNYAVNVSHIVAVRQLTRLSIEVTLSNGMRLAVARRRWIQIRDRLYQLGMS